MDDMKLLSTEAEGVNEAIAEEHRKALVNGAGRVGALLGLQSPQDSSSASADKEADSTGRRPRLLPKQCAKYRLSSTQMCFKQKRLERKTNKCIEPCTAPIQ